MASTIFTTLLMCHIISGVFSTLGKNFLVTFQENELYEENDPHPQCMTLTTTLNGNIAVQVTSLYPDINFNTNVVINNTISEYICLDNSIQLKGTGLSKKVVKVSADNDISVMVHDIETHSTDSYTAIPVEKYGTDYFIMSYFPKSQFSVTGKENDTVVRIEFPKRYDISFNYEFHADEITFRNSSNLEFTIQEYKVYQFKTDHDLTGGFVSSNKPIAVISGNKKIKIYSWRRAIDHLAEQMPPVDTWGTHFISVPSPGKNGTDLYAILASSPSTTLTIGITSYFIEEEGGSVRFNLSSTNAFEIFSDKPVLVVKYFTKGTKLDQCMMMVVPQRQWLNQYTFHFPQMVNDGGYLIIVVESRFRTSIQLNNEPISIVHWIEVGNANLSVGHILLPNALYTVYLPETDGNFAAYIQHFNRKFAYCTHIGMKMEKINMGSQNDTNQEDFTELTSTGMASESATEKTTLAVSAPTTETSTSSAIRASTPTTATSFLNNILSTPTSGTTSSLSMLSPTPNPETKSSLNVSSHTPTNSTTRLSSHEQINMKTCFIPNPRLLNLSMTDEEFLNIIEELKQHLKVVPQTTSQAIRKKISVPDYRPSSTTIGMSWWTVVIVLFMVGTFLSDILQIVRDIRFGIRK